MWLTILLLSCAPLRDYVPQGAVMGTDERAVFSTVTSQPHSTGAPQTELPVIPFTVFGLHYKKDIVLQTNDPMVDMLEVVMVEVPTDEKEDGQAWFAKTSNRNGTQTLFSEHAEIMTWLPGVNAPRKVLGDAFELSHSTTDSKETIHLQFPLEDGRVLRASSQFRSEAPHPRKTNSSTFNHSQDIAMALLEISAKDTRISASITLDEKPVPLKNILGIVPVKAFLEQTQGGITTASMTIHDGGDSEFHIRRPATGGQWEIPGEQVCQIESSNLRCVDALSSTTYRFEQGGLVEAVVHQWSGEQVFRLQLNAPLPNLSLRFEGQVERGFVADIGQLQGAGTGIIQAQWEDSILVVEIRPEAPHWFAARPMRSTIQFGTAGDYTLETVRIDPL